MQVRKTKKELGAILVEKGIISPEDLLSALDVVSKDTSKNRRKLHQVLVDDYKADRDKVYREVADYYAFRTIDLSKQPLSEEQIEFIRRELNGLPESVRELAAEHRVMPYQLDATVPDRLVIITPDPTLSDVYFIARAFPYKKSEIAYVPFGQWDQVWQKVNIARSTYRDKETRLRDVTPTQDIEEDSEVYEQDLEEEIHRSGLVDLVDNILMDAVRVGASDIHVIPRGEKKTDFYFRIDGRLTLWYSHNETRAEAVAAVVKDHAINVDRFERNAAQDGFAQFTVDRKMIRFRVSVIPDVGKELRNKFESSACCMSRA